MNELQRPNIDYYAFRHLPYEQFVRIQTVYSLFYQLISLPTCSEDINVIRHKTQFWLTELQALYTGTPHHPISLKIKTLLTQVPLNQADWLKIMTAIEMQIDGLLLENDQEIEQYSDRLYGSLYRMVALILRGGEPTRKLAYARTLLHFLQDPEPKIRVLLPENINTQVYTLFEQAMTELKPFKELKPLRILARLYQHQAQQAMVNLSPLKILWLSICERLSS